MNRRSFLKSSASAIAMASVGVLVPRSPFLTVGDIVGEAMSRGLSDLLYNITPVETPFLSYGFAPVKWMSREELIDEGWSVEGIKTHE